MIEKTLTVYLCENCSSIYFTWKEVKAKEVKYWKNPANNKIGVYKRDPSDILACVTCNEELSYDIELPYETVFECINNDILSINLGNDWVEANEYTLEETIHNKINEILMEKLL